MLNIFLLSSCIPKPNGSSFIDTAIFSNYFISSQAPIALRVRVQGLAAGSSLTISNQNSESLTILGNGDFDFPEKKRKYSDFSVSIVTQPVAIPSQFCAITNPTGILSPNSNTVEINCGTKFFNLNVNVFGIATGATGALSIRNGAIDTLVISSDGSYTFAGQVPDLGAYSVSVLTNPNQHNCLVEAVPPAAGIINNAPITLNVNCLSLMNSTPINQTVLDLNSSIQFTFSKPVTPMSCSFTAPIPTPASGPCASNLGAFASALNAGSYVGNTITITPATTWTAGLEQCIQLSGCTEAGTGRPFNLVDPLRYGVTSQIKYVRPGGAVAGTCSTIATACDKIQFAVSQCNTITPCYVLVAQGFHTISTVAERVGLIDKLQLLGGFRTDFLERDIDTFATVIQDTVATGSCGLAIGSEGTSCAVIAGGVFTLNANILIQGFTILTNANNPWSTGILLGFLTTGTNRLMIDRNAIFGTDSTATAAYGISIVRSGIYADSVGTNLIISNNYIVGGSGNSISAGIRLINGTQAIISGNSISGGSHVAVFDGIDFSLGISIANATNNTTQLLFIVNNVFNPHHLTSPTPVTAASSAAVQALSINSPNFIFVHNTMFGGVGTNRSYGIHQQAAPGNLNLNLINNQIVTNPTAADNTCLNYDANSVNNLASDIRGNNFIGCTTPVRSGFPIVLPFGFCGPQPGSLMDTSLCGTPTPLTNAGHINFGHNPIFDPPAGFFNVFRLSSTSRCDSIYGGVDPGFAFPISQLYQLDRFGIPRTTNVAPAPVPFGSFGYSIGAHEHDGICTP
ncbi:hypothetical protein AB3N59_12585 [Leptospira sp. WS92.C1]